MFVYWQTISKIAKYFSQELFLIVADHLVSPAILQLTQSADFDEIFLENWQVLLQCHIFSVNISEVWFEGIVPARLYFHGYFMFSG